MKMKVCKMCQFQFLGSTSAVYCGPACRKLGANNYRPSKRKFAAPNRADLATAEEILARAIARENLPPWERHPQPWTDVRLPGVAAPALSSHASPAVEARVLPEVQAHAVGQ